MNLPFTYPELVELQVFDNLPVTFWASLGKEHNYRICFWNKGCEKIYGYTKNESIGKSYVDLFVDEPAKSQSKLDCDRVISGEFIHPANCLAIDKNKQGEEVILLTNVFRYIYKGVPYQAETAVNLTPSGFIKFLDDEYREKRNGPNHEVERTLEAFINHTHNVIERKRSIWSRTFAHEIRSELSAIRHALEGLSDHTPTIRNLDEYKQIERAHRELYLHSQNFLFSQGRILIEQVPELQEPSDHFELNKVIDTIIDEYRYASSIRGLSIRSQIRHLTPDFIYLKGSQKSFKHVVNNLLNNAIKHSNIDLISDNPSPEIEISWFEEERFLRIQIINFGQLSNEELQNLFTPYYKSNKNPAEGLHLGLSIAKQWTDDIKGNLSLKNYDAKRVIADLQWPFYDVERDTDNG